MIELRAPEHMDGEIPLVESREVSKIFAQKAGMMQISRRFVRAVDRVSLAVNKGQIVGLVGESGCGKSTLGKLLIRLENPTQGAVLFNGRDITRLRGAGLRKQRNGISQWYGELKRSSGNSWEDVKKGFLKSYQELRDTFDKVRSEF